MRITKKPLAAAALACAALVPATAAQAATKTVDVGLAKQPAGAPETAGYHDFFPRTVKVHVGDTVSYRIMAFASVYFGKKKPPVFAFADAENPITGSKDPLGNPFWFEGQPSVAVNMYHLQPQGDGKVGGKGIDASGLQDGPPKPYKVKFTKPGSYKVIDAIHPYIKGKVVVVPKGKKVPSASADKARAAKQVAKLVKEAKKRAAVEPAANTILVGNDTRNIGFYQFFPQDLTVKAGTPITLTTAKYAGDIHNLVIGPMDYLKEMNPFQPSEAGFHLLGSAVYPSQAPTAPLTFDGTQNGGFLGSGALDADASTALPSQTTVTLTKPGTYEYFCLFHAPDMAGKITVTE